LSLGEIGQGIVRIRSRGDDWQAAALERWLRDTQAAFTDRILPVTLSVASAWGRQQHAQPLPVVDGLIAATAQVQGLTMVTRNFKNFQRSGIQVFNPFAN
jgi:toxin FitB